MNSNSDYCSPDSEGFTHDPSEGVVPDEEERVVYPPVQEETITPWGEGSSSGWGAGPSSSSWDDPRTSVYGTEGACNPWTYQHYPREEAPGDRSRRSQLRPKSQLGGVRTLLPFHCIFRF